MIDGNGHPIEMGPTIARLPVSFRIRRRPVLSRAVRRLLRPGTLEPPTEAEKQDAIEVLREGCWYDDPRLDLLYCEAERIFAEASDAP